MQITTTNKASGRSGSPFTRSPSHQTTNQLPLSQPTNPTNRGQNNKLRRRAATTTTLPTRIAITISKTTTIKSQQSQPWRHTVVALLRHVLEPWSVSSRCALLWPGERQEALAWLPLVSKGASPATHGYCKTLSFGRSSRGKFQSCAGVSAKNQLVLSCSSELPLSQPAP